MLGNKEKNKIENVDNDLPSVPKDPINILYTSSLTGRICYQVEAQRGCDVQVARAEALCFSPASALATCTSEPCPAENPRTEQRSTGHERASYGKKTRLLVFILLKCL
jgi:hypothetical protein